MLRFSVSIHRLPSSDSKFLRLALTCLESKDWVALTLPEKESNAQHKQTAVDAGIFVVNTRVRNMMKAPLSGQRCLLAYEIVKTHA